MQGKCNKCQEAGEVTRLLEVSAVNLHGINVYKVTNIVDEQLCYYCIEEICDMTMEETYG